MKVFVDSAEDTQTSGELFKELFYTSPLATYMCDAQGYITYFNEAAVLLWGRTPEAGKDLWCGSWKIYYPDGKPMPLDTCPMALTLKEGRSFSGEEIHIERPDHSFRQLLVYPRPLFNARAILIGAYDTLVDITEQRKGEEYKARLSAIVESSDDAIISKNLNGIITSWNMGAERIFGYSPGEIIGQSVLKLIPPLLQAEEEIIISRVKSGDKIDHFETVRIAKSGKQIPISLTVSPIKDTHNNIIGASKIARDISIQLEKEAAIKQGAERLEILNSIGKTISEKLEVKTILQRVTDATTKITGAAFGAFYYNTNDQHGASLTFFTLSGTTSEAFERSGMPANTVLFNSTFTGKGVIRADDITKDTRYGKNAPHKEYLPIVSYLAVPVVSTTGIIIGGLFFGHPAPAIFNAEHEALVVNIAAQTAVALDNSKLFEEIKALNAKKDEFIALASHELKSPLTIVKGYLQLLEKKENDSVSTLFLEKSLYQVNKLNSLISDLFDVSRIEAGKLELVYEEYDLKLQVIEIIETFGYSNPSHTILFNSDKEKCLLLADRQKIEQVIINLLSNAIKYSPDADKVYVELLHSEKEVTIKVRDEGIGMHEEQQHKIFSRFYRIEGEPNVTGLGLGLYLSKEIIERHHGNITVISSLAKGAQFILTIPVRPTFLKSK